MAKPMTPDVISTFLESGTRTAKIATSQADGTPHVAPVWFVLDGQDVIFMTGASSVKGRALRRDPRVAISVDDEDPPYSFVMIQGEAEVSDDLDAMLPWSIKIARRYMGDDKAEEFGRRNAAEGEVLVRVRPTKTVALADLAD